MAVILSGHTKILFSIPQQGSPQLEPAEGGSSLLQKLKFNLCLIIKPPNNSFHVWAEPWNYKGGSKPFYTGWSLLMWKFPGASSSGLINDLKKGEQASVLWHWLKMFLFPSRLQKNLWVGCSHFFNPLGINKFLIIRAVYQCWCTWLFSDTHYWNWSDFTAASGEVCGAGKRSQWCPQDPSDSLLQGLVLGLSHQACISQANTMGPPCQLHSPVVSSTTGN